MIKSKSHKYVAILVGKGLTLEAAGKFLDELELDFPSPKALPGNSVVVVNYRCRNRKEKGTIMEVKSNYYSSGKADFVYLVYLDRKSRKTGKPLKLTVTDAEIVKTY